MTSLEVAEEDPVLEEELEELEEEDFLTVTVESRAESRSRLSSMSREDQSPVDSMSLNDLDDQPYVGLVMSKSSLPEKRLEGSHYYAKHLPES